MEIIQKEIKKKNSFTPYFPDPNLLFNIKTDINQFPYPRFFRGKINSSIPHFWDREAGYSPIINNNSTPLYSSSLLIAPKDANFQPPCSTILPSFINNSDKVYISP